MAKFDKKLAKELEKKYGNGSTNSITSSNQPKTNTIGNSTPSTFNLDQLKCEAKGFLWWKNVPRNTFLVVENRITKNVKFKPEGIRTSSILFQKKTVLKKSFFSIQYTINEKEGAETEDRIDVHGVVKIEYQIDIDNFQKYYDEEFSSKQIDSRSLAITKELISTLSWEQITQRKINMIDEHSPVQESVTALAKQYGITIKSIDTTALKAPEEITNLEEKRRQAENENAIRVKQAQAEKEAQQYRNEARLSEGKTEAQIEVLKGQAEAKKVEQFLNAIKSLNLDAPDSEILEILKRSLTKQNTIIIEGNNQPIDSQTILMAISQLQNKINNEPNQQGKKL